MPKLNQIPDICYQDTCEVKKKNTVKRDQPKLISLSRALRPSLKSAILGWQKYVVIACMYINKKAKLFF